MWAPALRSPISVTEEWPDWISVYFGTAARITKVKVEPAGDAANYRDPATAWFQHSMTPYDNLNNNPLWVDLGKEPYELAGFVDIFPTIEALHFRIILAKPVTTNGAEEKPVGIKK